MEETRKKVISVIIPAKDAAQTLPACLKGVLHQDGLRFGTDYEVIVVDDGSRDSTADIAASMGVRVIRQANAGPASARNHGAREARGELLAFTDADCIPASGWLKALMGAFTDARVAGAKGIYQTVEKGWVPRFVQCEYAYKYQRLARQETIDFIDTYSAAYRREVFLQHGGFNIVFPVPSVEDQEFSFRLARRGYRLVFCPAAVVYHRHDLQVGEYARRKFGIGYWKAVMLKWLPEKALSDSHTPPSQRWQIILLGLSLVTAMVGLVFHPAIWVSAFSLTAFLISNLPFFTFIAGYDRPVLWLALPMTLVRAAALMAGILWAVMSPPRIRPRPDKE